MFGPKGQRMVFDVVRLDWYYEVLKSSSSLSLSSSPPRVPSSGQAEAHSEIGEIEGAAAALLGAACCIVDALQCSEHGDGVRLRQKTATTFGDRWSTVS